QARRRVVRREHQLNAPTQLRVLAAGLVQPGGSLRRRHSQDGQKQLFQGWWLGWHPFIRVRSETPKCERRGGFVSFFVRNWSEKGTGPLLRVLSPFRTGIVCQGRG